MKPKHILLIFLVFLVEFISSQGGPGAPGGPFNNCWPPPCIPIDGGITIITIVAAFFGFKNLSKIK
tara:strand:- start:59 stop:256 length:198 start_codon:yes stop_codon:yes gene_type:complete